MPAAVVTIGAATTAKTKQAAIREARRVIGLAPGVSCHRVVAMTGSYRSLDRVAVTLGTGPAKGHIQPMATCPICEKKPAEPAYRPFCSKRCADVDLHRWLSGVYAVPVTELDDEDGEAPSQDEPPPRNGSR